MAFHQRRWLKGKEKPHKVQNFLFSREIMHKVFQDSLETDRKDLYLFGKERLNVYSKEYYEEMYLNGFSEKELGEEIQKYHSNSQKQPNSQIKYVDCIKNISN